MGERSGFDALAQRGGIRGFFQAAVTTSSGSAKGSQLEAIAREVQQRAIAELGAKAGLCDLTVDDVIT